MQCVGLISFSICGFVGGAMRSLMKLVKEKDPILSKDLVNVLATLWWVCYC